MAIVQIRDLKHSLGENKSLICFFGKMERCLLTFYANMQALVTGKQKHEICW